MQMRLFIFIVLIFWITCIILSLKKRHIRDVNIIYFYFDHSSRLTNRHTCYPVILLECLQKSVWSQTEIRWKWKSNMQWFRACFLIPRDEYFRSSSRKNKYHHKHADKQSVYLTFCFSIVFQSQIVVYATL